MGFFDRLKITFTKSQESDTEELKQFKRCKNLLEEDIKRFKTYINTDLEKLNKYNQEGMKKDDPLYRSVKNDLERFTYSLYEAEKAINFIRPNKESDIEHRRNIGDNFSNKLKEILPQESNLRFHGTPIYFAKEILYSGVISSSADRFDGYVKSTDFEGEFSVSSVNSIQTTVNWFLDLESHQRCLPCGALFVFNGDDQTAHQYEKSVMSNVNLKETPEKLYAIVSTPENIDNLKQWSIDAGLSPDLTLTFDEFLIEMEKSYTKEDNCDLRIDIDEELAKLKNETQDVFCDLFNNSKENIAFDEVYI